MGMKVKEITYNAPTKQILAIPDHYVALGQKHDIATVETPGLSTLIDGRYIVKAGTIWPSNDLDAKGVILNDYDVTDGDQMMAVVIHGFIKVAALPVAPSSTVPASQLETTPFTITEAVLGAKDVLAHSGIAWIEAVV